MKVYKKHEEKKKMLKAVSEPQGRMFMKGVGQSLPEQTQGQVLTKGAGKDGAPESVMTDMMNYGGAS